MANATRIGVILVGLVVAWQLHELRAELRETREAAETIHASAEAKLTGVEREAGRLNALGRRLINLGEDAP